MPLSRRPDFFASFLSLDAVSSFLSAGADFCSFESAGAAAVAAGSSSYLKETAANAFPPRAARIRSNRSALFCSLRSREGDVAKQFNAQQPLTPLP